MGTKVIILGLLLKTEGPPLVGKIWITVYISNLLSFQSGFYLIIKKNIIQFSTFLWFV